VIFVDFVVTKKGKTMKNIKTGICATLTAVAMLNGFNVMAQDDAPPVEKAAVQAKLAIELGAPFRDDAVLQRDMKVPVWGWSKPGTVVTVEFAGQKKQRQLLRTGNGCSNSIH
jgi:hypothetical protein